jgi:prepilin signal peptidase PulO-like enzyme (type II secretory pathway)
MESTHIVSFFLFSAIFVLGTIVGSFLNVVILRTHTARSLGGHSHCMSCGERLRAIDLIPVLSYIALQGRCRQCGARVSPRYILIELTSGLLFLAVFSLGLDMFSTILSLLFLSILLIIFVYDIEHLIIPDEYVVALAVLALISLSWGGEGFVLPLITDLAAPVLTFGFLGGLWKISKGEWIGLGDAKLSMPLALMVGLTASFSLIVCAFWLGAVVSVTLLGIERMLARGKHRLRFLGAPLTMKAEVPFAPFLIGSFLFVTYAHADVFMLTDAILAYLTAP